MPFRLNSLPVAGHFIERNVEMEQMEHTLLRSNSHNGRRIKVLYGLGGMGKTQLAIAYARKHRERYSAIIWLDGNSKDTVFQSLAAFSTYAGVDSPRESTVKDVGHDQDTAEKVNAVLKWLALEGNHQWLIVLDNVNRDFREAVDSQAYDIESFLPAADHGSILITTRLFHFRELFGNATMVSQVDSKQALQILTENLARPMSESTPGVFSLLTALEGVPLAIVQASSYMRETGTSCQQYLELYNTDKLEFQRRLHDYPDRRSAQATWSISYNRVNRINPAAAKLLQLWAFLDNQDLSFELMKRGSRGSKDPVWLQDIVRSKIGFRSMTEELLAYSLIESHEDTESYSIHPVSHDWCLESISRYKPELITLATMIVGFAAPKKTEPEYWLMQRRLLPHANKCVRQLSTTDTTTQGPDIYDALHNLGDLYTDQAKPAEAEKMYQRALDGKETSWGSEHTSTLDTVNNLGKLYENQGKMAEAEKMYKRALEGREKAWGPEHTSTLDTVHNLGLLYANQGKMAEAEKMYKRVLEGRERAWGPKHTSTLETVNNLGLLYADQGKMVEAEKMYKLALEGREKAWGPEHVSTLETVNNLGLLYADQGKMAEAEKMYERALEGREKAWGPEHTSTLDTVNNLGALYANQGKMAEAEKMYQRALEGREKAWGPEHTSTLETVNNLGLLYADQGKMAEAEKMYQRALRGKAKVWGPDHISTFRTMNNLGALYANQGETAKAEKIYQRVLSGMETTLGTEHQTTLGTLNNLGALYANRGEMAEAEKMYRQASRGKEKIWGPEHPSTLDTVNNLGALYADQGKKAEAEKMYERVLSGREKALGPEHTSTLDVVNNLGLLYADQGKMAEAEKMYQRALRGKAKAWGPDHISTINTLSNLGKLYQSQGELEEARKVYSQVLQRSIKAQGAHHPLSLYTANELGNIYTSQGKLAEAENTYLQALDGGQKVLGIEHMSALRAQTDSSAVDNKQTVLQDTERSQSSLSRGFKITAGRAQELAVRLITSLGSLYLKQGRVSDGEDMFLRASKCCEEIFGIEDPVTLDAVITLGSFYEDISNLGSAEVFFRRAMIGYTRSLGANHPSTENASRRLSYIRTLQHVNEESVTAIRSLSILSAESDRDDDVSLPSSATSISVIMPPAKKEEFVLGLARLFQEDADIQATVRKAIERSKDELRFDQQRMVRSFTGILRRYSRELRETSHALVEANSARFVRANYRSIATAFFQIMRPREFPRSRTVVIADQPVEKLMLDRFFENAPAQDLSKITATEISQESKQLLDYKDNDGDGSSSDGSETSDVQEPQINHPVEMVEAFMISGEPFANLKQRLRNFVERGTLDDIEKNTTEDRQHDFHQSRHSANRAMIQIDDGRPLRAVAAGSRFLFRFRSKMLNWVDLCYDTLYGSYSGENPDLTYFTWTCRCGRTFRESVHELTSGAVDGWKRSMTSGENDEERSSASSRSEESATQSSDGGSKNPNKTGKRKPYKQSELPLTDIDLDLRSDNVVERPQDTEFVLLCIQQKPHRIKLVHANIYGKSNDQDAFASMKSTYKAYRASWWRLNRLSHIEFRKFQLYDSQHVDLSYHTTEQIPVCRRSCVEGCGNGCMEYWYSPAKAKMIPPIPRNAMIHSLEDPQCRGTRRAFRAALPKRRERLKLGSGLDIQDGWGLSFKDTIWEAPILTVQLASIIAAVVVAIHWTRIHGSSVGSIFPGAFVLALGQCIAALMQRWAESNLVDTSKDNE